MRGACSICAAPPEVLKAVNEALGKKEKLRNVAKRSGFSKSTLGRHRLNCLPREIIASNRSKRFNSASGQVFVSWPDDPSCPPDVRGKLLNDRGAVVASLEQITENDIVMNVVYEAPSDYYGLLDSEGRYLSADTAHARALQENAERDATEENPPEAS